MKPFQDQSNNSGRVAIALSASVVRECENEKGVRRLGQTQEERMSYLRLGLIAEVKVRYEMILLVKVYPVLSRFFNSCVCMCVLQGEGGKVDTERGTRKGVKEVNGGADSTVSW